MAKRIAQRVIFVGQAPNRANGKPFGRSYSATRLASLLGISFEMMHEKYELTNLLSQYTGRGGSDYPRGDAFPLQEARDKAAELRSSLKTGSRLVLLGRGVSQAFSHQGDWFEWTEQGGLLLASCPHPSGVSKWWHVDGNRKQAERFLGRL